MSGFAKFVDEALSAAGRAADGAKAATGEVNRLERLPLPDLNQIKTPKGVSFADDPVPKNKPLFSNEPAPELFGEGPVPTPMPSYESAPKRTVDGLKPFDNPSEVRARQTELLTEGMRKIGQRGDDDSEVAVTVGVAFKRHFNIEATPDDVALLETFGYGIGGLGGLQRPDAQLRDLDDMLKVSASILEVAPEVKDINTSMKLSNGAPLVMWRGGNLRVLINNPKDMFTTRIDTPTEVGAHAGSFDQATDFTGRLGSMRNAFVKGENNLRAEVTILVEKAMPRRLRSDAAVKQAGSGAQQVFKDFFTDNPGLVRQTEALLEADNPSALSIDKYIEEFEKGGYSQRVLDAVKKAIPDMTKQDEEEFVKDLERTLLRSVKLKDIGDGVTKRTGQLVPYVPIIKNPIIFRDVGSNDADSIIDTVENFKEKAVSDYPVFKEIAAKYRTKESGDLVKDNKLLQDLLREAGFDAMQYLNTTEGVGGKMSLVMLDEANIKPLHEIIPQLGKLKEALRKRVYNMMAVGVPLNLALQIVQMEEEGNDTKS